MTWLMDDSSNDDDEDETPLTFNFICEALDLDKDNLRKAISLQERVYQETSTVMTTEQIAV